MEKELVIYKVEEGEVVFDIDQEKETVWATQEEIAKLFGVDRTVVGRYLRNIFKDEELEEERVCAKNARTAADGKTYQTKFYNLDAIISVGYRVNSKKATKFRVWSTSVLKKYIVEGAAVNERRLKELPEEKLKSVETTLGLVRRLMLKSELEEEEAKGILEVISQYGRTLETIKEFDSGAIPAFFNATGKMRRNLSIGDAKNLAENLKAGEFRTGQEERFGKFLVRLETEETGKTVAEKAARLLYFVVKTKPFEEANKEVGALLFIYFLTINDFRLSENGETKISDRALAAIVLLISESETKEKELMIQVVTKLLE